MGLLFKAFIKAGTLGLKSKKRVYNPLFVEKILQGREDIKNGKGIKIMTDDLWK